MKKSLFIFFFILAAAMLFAGCTNAPNVEKQVSQQSPSTIPTLKTEDTTPSPTLLNPPEATPVNVNGLDTTSAVIMGPYVYAGIKNLSPLYSDLRDDFATKDYDKMASDSQKLKRFVEDELDNIGYDDRKVTNDKLGKLSTKDTMIYKKYEGYLNNMKKLSESIQIPLSWIKDDPSKVELGDKLDSFSVTFSISKDSKDKVEAMMDSCEEFKADCGENLTGYNELTKELSFF